MNILDSLFPPKCVFCGQFISAQTPFRVCRGCCAKYCCDKQRRCSICDKPLSAQYGVELCQDCRKSRPKYTRHFAPLIYTKEARRSVLASKFAKRTVYLKTFAVMTYQRIRTIAPQLTFDYIMYVPLTARKQAIRGYNQCGLFAENLSGLFSTPVAEGLVKIKDTPPQSKLTAAQRILNVKGAFALNGHPGLIDKTVLLVDDIKTTGSTLNECAGILIRAGALEVYTASAAISREFRT